MTTHTDTPEVTASATVRDEDSALHIQRIAAHDGEVSIALWGTEDTAPDVALAYTLVPEADLIAFLAEAGYTVTRNEVNA